MVACVVAGSCPQIMFARVLASAFPCRGVLLRASKSRNGVVRGRIDKYARATPSQQPLPGLRACGQHLSGRSRLPVAGSAPAAEVCTQRRRHRCSYIVIPHTPRGRCQHPAHSAASPPGAVSLPWRRPVRCHARTRPRARAQCTRTQALSRGKTRRARPPAPGP